MKTAAAALVLLLACACVSGIHAKSKFCRTSAFAVDCATLKTLKEGFFKTCAKANVKVISPYTLKGKCCTVTQQVADKNTWENVFIPCEHGTNEYKTKLKAASDPCISEQKKFAC